MLSIFPYCGGTIPQISALSHDLGDTLGGDTVVITGRNFSTVTGAAGVKFGATNAASYVVDSDQQITAVSPAASAGSVNITVTNGVGTSTDTAAYEFWSPAVVTPQWFWDSAYTTPYVKPGGGTPATWPYRYRHADMAAFAGIWTNNAAESTQPTATGGRPVFDRAASQTLFHGNGTALQSMSINTVMGGGDCMIACGFQPVDILTADADSYDNEALFADDGLVTGLFLGGTSSNEAFFLYWDGAKKEAKLTLPVVAANHVVVGERNGGNLRITRDGSAWTAGSTGTGVLAGGSGNLRLYTRGSTYGKGTIKFLILDDAAWSAANVTKLYKWAAVRHP